MRARLTLETGHADPAVFFLDDNRVVKIGRNKKNNIVLHDQHASRWHAEIVEEDGNWVLRETASTNGTRVNGHKLTGPHLLEDGEQLRFGDTVLRFDLLDERDTDPADEEDRLALPPALHSPSISDSTGTVLQPDELQVLLQFMNFSQRPESAHDLIRLALHTLVHQTEATLTGYLSLDPHDLLPRLVYPQSAKLNTHLSRRLTAEVQRRGRTVWLHEPNGPDLGSDSLVEYGDAFCVPIPTQDAPLGAIHVYRKGAKFVERDLRFTELLVGYMGRSLEALRARRALEADNTRLQQRVAAGPKDEILGESLPMRKLREMIRRFAERPNALLIVGETGSGKELVAQRLHQLSPRHKGPLVIVNCAALALARPEAELFGQRASVGKDGPQERAGYFAQAEEGTLFLDEVSELPLDCQASLLRAISTQKYRPVDADADVQADVRIFAATNRDLEQECQQGRFRWDLFYQLGVTIQVPPLRERAEDIPELVDHFLSKMAREYKRTVQLSLAALRRLDEYRWPGNVRQLRTVLEHAVANTAENEIQAEDLFLGDEAGAPTLAGDLGLNLETLEKWAICQALHRTRGNNSQAANLLGIHRDTLLAKIRKYDIDRDRESGRK